MVDSINKTLNDCPLGVNDQRVNHNSRSGGAFEVPMNEIPIYRIALVREAVTPYPAQSMTNAESVADAVRVLVGNDADESFFCVMVDVKNKIVGMQVVARGGPETVTFSPKDVFRASILCGASGVIIAHNHPSGDPTPSAEDKLMTLRLQEGAKLLGFRFLDSLVVGTENKYYSFAESGIL